MSHDPGDFCMPLFTDKKERTPTFEFRQSCPKRESNFTIEWLQRL